MTQQGMRREYPWQAPLDEEYWRALLQQGEFAPEVPSPVEEVLVGEGAAAAGWAPGLGAEAGFGPSSSAETSASPRPEGLRRGVGRGTRPEGSVEPLTEASLPKGPAEGYNVGLRESSVEAEEEAYLFSPEARWERDWKWLEQMFERGEVFTARVIGCNKGGLLVRLGEIRGFVPASQLAELPRQLGTEGLQEELEDRIGEELELKLIELDRQRNRVICSERATAWAEEEIERRLAELSEGQVVRGRVRSVCDFGAFVDLGGVDGLIHISELSWQRVDHPYQVLQVGDEVEALVLNVDRKQRRIGLSLKRLRPDPWSVVDERYHVGQVVEGTITNVVDFGAFARIEEGLEGLIHISELAEGNFLHPRNVVKEGDVVTVRILNIDSANHRLGLSLRQAYRPETDQWAGAPQRE
ncbi:MAG: 30S ribosomal protein S1 [Anaerolineae bacterium]